MQFANPLFLFALAAVAVPVIIHLYNFRRYKKVYFTNVRFIAEIEQESKKRSQLKHLLILLMRILAVASLVIAFSRPYIPSPLQQRSLAGRQSVSIYIDNTLSMEALATNGKLLDVAKTKAKEIVAAYKPSDLFQLLTADFDGKHQRFVSSEEFLGMVDEITFSPVFRPLKEVMSRQAEMLGRSRDGNRSAYIVSDFQRTTAEISDMKADTSVAWFFVPVAAGKSSNLFIDTAWFTAPSQQAGQAVKLNMRIRNSSQDALEKIPVKLTINGSQKAVASFSVAASGETVVTMPYTNNESDIQYGTLEITDYPVTWDDKFYFSYTIARSIPVLCINGDKPSRYLDALFGNDSTVTFRNENISRLDYSSFSRYPLIILNSAEEIPTGLADELGKFVRQGGNLILFPAAGADLAGYNALLGSLGQPLLGAVDTARQKVAELNTQSEVYRDVFERNASGKVILPDNMEMPSVYRHYVARTGSASGAEMIMKLQNGDPFLLVTSADRGRVWLFAAPPDEKWSNFMRHTLFVPTLYRIAFLSEAAPELYQVIGSGLPIAILNDTLPAREVYRIRKLGTRIEFIPETRTTGGKVMLITHDQVKEAGLFQVTEGTRIIQGVAFNYDRRESDMTCLSPADLQNLLKQAGLKYYSVMQAKKIPITRQIREMSQGTPLWKLFIVLTLLFLAAEIALIRIMKE